MKVVHTFVFVLRISYAAPTNAHQGDGDRTIQQATSIDINSFSAAFNSSHMLDQAGVSVNATLADSARIKCDGKRYGFEPSIADCMTAIQYFLPSRAQTTYAERGTPARKGDVMPLPLRIMGGMEHSL